MAGAGLPLSCVFGAPGEAKPSRASQFVTPASGLSTVQVAERVAAGRTNATDQRTSRTLAEILKASVFTVFNACW